MTSTQNPKHHTFTTNSWPCGQLKQFRGLNGRPVIKTEHIRRLTGRPTEKPVMKTEQIWRLTMMAKILS